jgi:hypothetical protein
VVSELFTARVMLECALALLEEARYERLQAEHAASAALLRLEATRSDLHAACALAEQCAARMARALDAPQQLNGDAVGATAPTG